MSDRTAPHAILHEPCSFCGRHHRIATLVPNPDRPGEFFCPVWARSKRVMRLAPDERIRAIMLLAELAGSDR